MAGRQRAAPGERAVGEHLRGQPAGGEPLPGGPGLGQRQPQQHPGTPRQGAGEVDPDHLPQPDPLRQRHDGGQGVVPGHHHLGAVVEEHRLQLVRGVQRVVLHHLGADPQRRQGEDEVGRAGRQQHRDPVPGAHADPQQAGRHPVHLGRDLPVAAGAAQEVDAGARAVAGHRLGEQVGDGALGVLQLPGGPTPAPSPVVARSLCLLGPVVTTLEPRPSSIPANRDFLPEGR